ncbi:MAG TPA: hypothetical protein VGR27_08065 [Longimicrobiaceae bacterium]|nr:hypothetical protein [Longimicrobiaceae bacterium]
MGLRHWLRHRMVGEEAGDVPPSSSLVGSLLGREPERASALGEYNSRSYPPELAELLRNRQEVTEALLRIDIADPDARVEAVPQLRELLRIYPHPLVYETLVLAYVHAGRYDEAKGVAFAAQARREECARSDYPEIRAEIEHLKGWTSEEVDRLCRQREERRSRAPG